MNIRQCYLFSRSGVDEVYDEKSSLLNDILELKEEEDRNKQDIKEKID
jgi:hypothetical protein